MNRRCIGGIFFILAALFFITKFIVYAIIISSVFSTGTFAWTNIIYDLKPYIEKPLNTASFVSLLIGISFIVYAEFRKGRGE